MPDLLLPIFILSGLVILLSYVRLVRAISYSGGVPRFGKPGLLGYIKTALRYTMESDAVVLEGRTQFGGRPFVIPTLASGFSFYRDRGTLILTIIFSDWSALSPRA